MKFRSDIEGLRAIAILAILLFHAGIKSLSGGYVGVDIFFVISGYLISAIIRKEIQTNTFSLKNFYLRRAKRLLPALFSVMFVTSLFAYKYLYPFELLSYAKSAIASLLFAANLYFYATLNYFSPSADTIPLLHLWSLGIEEQFYFIFPLLMMLMRHRFMHMIKPLLIILLLISLISSSHVLKTTPNAAFYLPPLRAFELLIGCMLAFLNLPTISNKFISSLIGTAGWIAMLTAILTFHASTPFPGYAALLPCAGAALIIIAGEQSYANKLLTLQPFSYIGKISYSLYLVHWPLVVFVKRLYPDMPTTEFVAIVLIASFFAAALNYQFIERIFHSPQPDKSAKKVVGFSCGIASIFIMLYIATLYAGGFAHFDKRIERITAYLGSDHTSLYMMGTCFLNPDQKATAIDLAKCLPHTAENNKKIIIWGDSHATQIYPGLKETLTKKGFSVGVVTASACPPIIGFSRDDRPYCKSFNDYILPIILREKPRILIMTASWPITDKKNLVLLQKTIQSLVHYPFKIVLLGESPMYKRDVPTIIVEKLSHSGNINDTTDVLETDYLKTKEEIMSREFGQRSDLQYISVWHEMCPQGTCPLLTSDGAPVHFDIAHLTAEGSKLFAEKLTPLILQVLQKEKA